MDNKIKRCQEKYNLLKSQIITIEEYIEEEQDIQKQKELKSLNSTIDDFIWNEYSMVVFDVYSKTKPKLKDKYSKEVKTWEEVFGFDFEKIPRSLRESLVGLIELDGRYTLKK